MPVERKQELKENNDSTSEFFPFRLHDNHCSHPNVLYMHWHENIEIIYMQNGQAVFYIDEKPVEAQSGDILFVNSGELHSGYSVNNTFVRYFAIVFDRVLLSGSSPDPAHTRHILPFINGERRFPERIGTGHPSYRELKGYLDEIIREYNERKDGFEVAVKAYFQLLAVGICRNFRDEQTERRQRTELLPYIESFRQLIDYIEQHHAQKLTIGDGAGMVNLSPHHFCKTFKRLTGRTFIEYVNLCRVNRAEELLRTTNLPVTRIAEQVGFCNINYFDKVFRACKRYPPSQSRKKAL